MAREQLLRLAVTTYFTTSAATSFLNPTRPAMFGLTTISQSSGLLKTSLHKHGHFKRVLHHRRTPNVAKKTQCPPLTNQEPTCLPPHKYAVIKYSWTTSIRMPVSQSRCWLRMQSRSPQLPLFQSPLFLPSSEAKSPKRLSILFVCLSFT